MARTMSDALKCSIESSMGVGSTAKIINCINSGHTALDGPMRSLLAKICDGIGEATALESAMTSNGSISVAAKSRLVKEFRGQGNAEEFALCVSDGTIT